MIPVEEKSLTLFDRATYLKALLDMEEGVHPEMEEAFRADVAEALKGTREKVDGVAAFLTNCLVMADTAKAEADAWMTRKISLLKKREERLRSAADRLNSYVLMVIRELGTDAKGKYKPLEGDNSTLKAAKVAASCEVYDETLVPSEFKDATVTFEIGVDELSTFKTSLSSGDCRKCGGKDPDKILQCTECDELGGERIFFTFPISACKVQHSIDKRRLLAALKEPCVHCNGKGYRVPADEHDKAQIPCSVCDGKKLRLIEGARIVDSKLRLVVE